MQTCASAHDWRRCAPLTPHKVEDSHSRGELEGRQSVELKVNKRTASLEICYESDTKRPALESQPPTAPPCALDW